MFKLPSPIEQVALGDLSENGVELWVKRDDLIHAEVSGNKWRKLKYSVQKAQAEGLAPLISFGGAFSNHLAALAAAGKLFDIPTIGIIRGEEAAKGNPTLDAAGKNGMQFRFVPRKAYREKEILIAQLRSEFENALVIPEGGADVLGVKGCMEIMDEVEEHFDVISAACGTGATLAGISLSSEVDQEVLGFMPMKQGVQLVDRIDQLMDLSIASGIERMHTHPYKLVTAYHFGGFAKINDELIEFMRHFTKLNDFYLDPVYTGKMFYGLFDMMNKGMFPSGSRILAIHSGGLQGLAGMLQKGISIYPIEK